MRLSPFRLARFLAGFSILHRFWVIGAWLVVLCVALLQARGLENKLYDGGGAVAGSDSALVDTTLATRFTSPFSQFLIVALADPAGHSISAPSATLAKRLGRLPWVTGLLPIPGTQGARAAWVVGLKSVSARSTEGLVFPLRQAIREDIPAGISTYVTGRGALAVDNVAYAALATRRAERLAIPLSAVALLFIFGTPAAALLPILCGGAAVILAAGILGFIAGFMPLCIYAMSIASMLGLGLGIDYALFVVARSREEGDDVSDLRRAMGFVSPAVMTSALAIVCGLLALSFAPTLENLGVAIGGAVVALTSLLVALTLLPALTAVMGRSLNWGRLRPRAWGAWNQGARWGHIAKRVTRRPWLASMLALSLLVIMAWPMGALRLGEPEAALLPQALESVQGVSALRAMGAGGSVMPVLLLLSARGSGSLLTPEHLKAWGRLAKFLRSDTRLGRVTGVVAGPEAAERLALRVALVGPARFLAHLPQGADALVSHQGNQALWYGFLKSDATYQQGVDEVTALRRTDWHKVLGSQDLQVRIGGAIATDLDFVAINQRAVPAVFLALVLVMALLLYGLTGSWVVPLKAIVANTLTVGAALGATFWLLSTPLTSHALGLAIPTHTLPPDIPLVAFCMLFGLSMDYEVFLVSRVLEARKTGCSDTEAIIEGVSGSGAVITSAAVLMVIVFSAFSRSDFLPLQVLGLALAIGIALDALVTRMFLLPALMALAGRWNWWPASWANQQTLEEAS